MLRATAIVYLVSSLFLSGPAVARQIPLLQPDGADLQPASYQDGNHAVHSQAAPRKLHGRFLQITGQSAIIILLKCYVLSKLTLPT